MTSATATPVEFPWTRVLAALTLRALARVHQDYLLWSVNQRIDQKHDIEELSTGPGVALADEVTVCSAISQEWIYSRYAWGSYFEADAQSNVQEGERYFQIEREMRYAPNDPENRQKVDLVVTRVLPGKVNVLTVPAWVEAKRAFLWSTNLLPTGLTYNPKSQYGVIRDDIKKLRSLDAKKFAHRKCLLVWNVADKRYPDTVVTPESFLNEIGDNKVEAKIVRVVPLTSDAPDDASSKFESRTVSRWLWLLLAEIDADELTGILKDGQVDGSSAPLAKGS